MLTNRIKVNYNMEKIDSDFDVFKVVKKNKDDYKYNILDLAVEEFKAEAVQWAFGTTAFVLFRKDEVTEGKFRDCMMKQYEDVQIQKIDLLNDEQCKQCFYYNYRLLAQLLMNSMRTPGQEPFRYHNLTGKLFYHDPSWILKDDLTGQVNFIRFLEVVLSPGMYLNLEHKTFRRCEQEGPGLYVIDPGTGDFRKKLKTDKDITTYKEGSLPHNHFRVDNFNITDYAHFRKSKLGIMEQFLRDVEEHLSQYMTIELMERKDSQEYEISNVEKKGITEREYGEMLRKKGVVIVDENGTEKSKNMITRLQSELKKHYSVEAVTGKLSKTAYNIRIIHDSEYYLKQKLNDPHGDNLKGYIVQHMTEEAEHFANTKGSSPDIKKVIQELIIKGDVREKQISIFDWKRMDSGKEWTFVLRKKKAPKQFEYYRLKIDGSGKMEFDTYSDTDQELSEEWNEICETYDTEENRHWGTQNHVEGLVYSDINHIHVILLTKEKTLPNISLLMKALKETDGKEKISKEKLMKAIEVFVTEHPDTIECVQEWKEKLSEEPERITKKKLKKILNMRLKISSEFNRFLHENYEIWIDGELRKEEFEATFQIGNLLNIKYEYNTNDFLDGNAFFYYVGAKSKKRSYPNACCIRKVISKGDCLEYEELLPLMAVEFVRNSQYTVLPFPYKYLREYMVQC